MMLHIHAPRPSAVEAHVRECPSCDRRRVFVAAFTEWYGWSQTCLGCGDRWDDGGRLERPFKPQWWVKRIEDARRRYRAGRVK